MIKSASPRLSDIHLLLLATAAARPDRGLLPPPPSLGELGDHIRSVIAELIGAGLAEEIPTQDSACVWRRRGKTMLGVAITAKGCALLEAPPPPVTKIGSVVAMLGRSEGATLDELVAETGWLPHTIRAALTRLRKKGHAILRTDRDGVSCYQIAEAA